MSTESQQAQFRFIPAGHLALSPLNVRQTGGENGIEQLAQLIAAEGVLQNLSVYEATNAHEATTHAVVAGGRRWRALQWLIERGRIEADYPVPCMVVSHDRAVQISLSENSGREPMHPADEFEAFRQLVDAGQSVEDVAARFGVRPVVVLRRLKLANVSPRFIALYREGEGNVTLEHLMAFAVTEDHARQEAAWDALKPYERNPEDLRVMLTEHELESRDAIARFVGVKAYEKAGGVVRRDLFAEEGEGTLLDGELVQRLAREKLEKHAAKLKGEGFSWVEVHPQWDYASRSDYGRVGRVAREPTEEERVRLQEIQAQKTRIEKESEEAEGDEGRLASLSDLENLLDLEIEGIFENRLIADPAQQTCAGAVVSIGRDGKVCIDRDLLQPQDARRFEREHKARHRTAKSGVPSVHSAVLTRRLTAQRTLALQAELVQQPITALIALTQRLVLATFYSAAIAGKSAVQLQLGATQVGQYATELEGTAAQETLAAHRKRHEEALPSDPEKLLSWLSALSTGDLLALLAFCVALTIDGVQSDEGPCATDALAKAAKLDMRGYWRPTAENYFRSIPKSRILAAVTEGASESVTASLAKLKKAALADAAERQLANTNWLPSMMRQPK